MKDEFIRAIHKKKKVRLSFYPENDGTLLIRTCAPMDYGPKRKAKNAAERFHVWDYESDTKIHPLSLFPQQIEKLEVLAESFDPSEFITWNTKLKPWSVKRDWGIYS